MLKGPWLVKLENGQWCVGAVVWDGEVARWVMAVQLSAVFRYPQAVQLRDEWKKTMENKGEVKLRSLDGEWFVFRNGYAA